MEPHTFPIAPLQRMRSFRRGSSTTVDSVIRNLGAQPPVDAMGTEILRFLAKEHNGL